LLISGLAAGVFVGPVLRKGVRGLLVQSTKMVLVASDQVREIGNKIGEDVNELMAEARAKAAEERTPLIAKKVHTATVAAVGTGLAAADRVRKVTDGFKERFTDLVDEARQQSSAETRETRKTAETGKITTETGEITTPVEKKG
jgi:F0F1-type ATP synthase membrane subunit b/b'